ncbi:hypothetical protein [Nostoc sp. NMS4]|uniref:hypothetical protein n=1 Tax=Nostoc sp. NMS4 TaxID=2815390 RepID=UPI0025E51879|nr:hypothetical protein [Nostoc sp. NMS4]
MIVSLFRLEASKYFYSGISKNNSVLLYATFEVRNVGYMSVFDKFGFGLRVRSRLLTRIYPFESFLGINGKPIVEHEVREVKRTERDAYGGKLRKNGETTVTRLAGDTKRIKRNRSRDTFKMRLGMGTVLEQSGDGLVEKPSGSSLCRISLWQYVLTDVETGRLPSNDKK